jgi:hypothetical protein
MYTFEATIRVASQLIRTRVYANNAYDAKLLLSAQYGSENVIGFVQQVY